jgi:transposase-like protein
MKNENELRTLREAIIHFSDPDNCREYMVARRWPKGVSCPTCGRADVTFLANQRKWQCKSVHSHRQFSVKVGTIFEDSPLGLHKWLPAVWMVTNCKNGISSYEIHRALGVTQKTAWYMLHRIRLAMHTGSFWKLGGGGVEVEVDETFIGGKARNMHASKRARRISGTGGRDKTAVMGILERGGEVRTKVVVNRRKPLLQKEVRDNVKKGSALYTDALLSYEGLDAEYMHQVINHAERYVNGRVHTNGLENFWSLLKRSLKGTYISVEPFHLFRYLDEQAFRFNNRKDDDDLPIHDGQRFERVMSNISGKRLTYDKLTGKNDSTTPD